MLRRMVAGTEEAAELVAQLLPAYIEMGRPGAGSFSGEPASEACTRGPLDLFRNTLARHGSYLDEELTVHLRDDDPIGLR